VLRQLSETEGRLKQVSYTQMREETFGRELTDALASGAGPDLVLLRSDEATREAPKLLPIAYEELSREQFQNTFVAAADPFLGTDGVLAVPLVVDPLVLFWNRDMLASAGFSQPPRYWDELYSVATAATRRSETNSIEKSTIAFGEYANVDHAKDILAMLILQAGGSVTARDSTGRLRPALMPRAGEGQHPTESALRFYVEFSNPAREHYTWNRSLQSSRARFAAGDLALYVGYASEEPLLRRMNPNLNLGAAPMPQIRTADTAVTGAHTYGFAVPRAAANPAGGRTVAYLLGSRDASSALSLALGIPSARRDVLSQAAQGNDELYNRQALIARAWLDPDTEATDRIFRDMIENVTSGSLRLSESIQRAEQAMAQLLTI
ncbi:hypothetical protein COU20_01180, partial [Candidatus Kaiserbacteria bacterium CG10_big_fil_rev_8_21_14_0_10_59_10]